MARTGRARILVIAPHPDDDIIGCGGLLAAARSEGCELFVLFLTVGNTVEASERGWSSLQERLGETQRVAEFLGYEDYEIRFPGDDHHLCLDGMPQRELINAIERGSRLSIVAVQPTAVLIPHPASYNQDHRAVAQAAITALRPSDGRFKFNPEIVLAYEQPADQWTAGGGPPPTTFVPLEEAHLQRKLEALSLCASQAREAPNSRSAEALRSLAVLRGAQSGHALAEGFHCLRSRLFLGRAIEREHSASTVVDTQLAVESLGVV